VPESCSSLEWGGDKKVCTDLGSAPRYFCLDAVEQQKETGKEKTPTATFLFFRSLRSEWRLGCALAASEACESRLEAQLPSTRDSQQNPPQDEIQQLASQLLNGGQQETSSPFEAFLCFGLPLIILVSAEY